MRFRNIERYRTGGTGNQMQLSIPLPRTPDGRVYRFSQTRTRIPVISCWARIAGFSPPAALTARMTHMPGAPAAVCPTAAFSMTMIPSRTRMTLPRRRRSSLIRFAQMFLMPFTVCLEDLARQNAGNKFLKMEGKSKPTRQPKPHFARRDLLRELVCDECGRDYGVYAISLFCPDCGAPNIHLHFAREVTLVREQVALAEQLDSAQRELGYRLLGNAHEDVLTAFEASLKAVYLHKAGTQAPGSVVKPVGNAFQNIERGQQRFSEFAFDPFAGLARRHSGS